MMNTIRNWKDWQFMFSSKGALATIFTIGLVILAIVMSERRTYDAAQTATEAKQIAELNLTPFRITDSNFVKYERGKAYIRIKGIKERGCPFNVYAHFKNKPNLNVFVSIVNNQKVVAPIAKGKEIEFTIPIAVPKRYQKIGLDKSYVRSLAAYNCKGNSYYAYTPYYNLKTGKRLVE